MERIDKVISSQSNFSRKEVRKMILKKRVTVDGEIVDKYDTKIDQSRVVKTRIYWPDCRYIRRLFV